MSMLAEKRQRKSWILNPRSTEWTNDSNKFGQKLLEKMGWTPGKGLGVNEQGMVNALRIKYKNDFKGLGCEHKDEDWIKTQEEFNTILAELGGGDEYKKIGEKSLEKTSKNMRSRVHYHKFTRGKDLSRYSAKDLESILGVNTNVANGNSITEINDEIKTVSTNYENFVKKGDMKESNSNCFKQQEQMLFSEIIVSSDDTKFSKKKKRKKKLKRTELIVEETSLVAVDENSLATSKNRKKKKKKINASYTKYIFYYKKKIVFFLGHPWDLNFFKFTFLYFKPCKKKKKIMFTLCRVLECEFRIEYWSTRSPALCLILWRLYSSAP